MRRKKAPRTEIASRRKLRYKAAMARACTEKQLFEIMKECVSQAQAGDWRARQCVLDYLIGKPESSGGTGATPPKFAFQFVDQTPA